MNAVFTEKINELQQLRKIFSYFVSYNEKLKAETLTVLSQDSLNRRELKTFAVMNDDAEQISEINYLFKNDSCKVVKFVTDEKFQQNGFAKENWNIMLTDCVVSGVKNIFGFPGVIADMKGYDEHDEDIKLYFQERDLVKIYKKLGCKISDEYELRFDYKIDSNNILSCAKPQNIKLVNDVVNNMRK